MPDVSEIPLDKIRRALLDWYERHRRVLPWRGSPDPYAVWVSEIMLQQTQVQTVIPYFERWMERFPTLRALAEAPLEEVLQCWAGLGYYARARNLHAAARAVVARHGGALPADSRALQALPGIGRYTAGAILSIAFGLPAPILDANAIRVLSRLFLVEGDPSRGPASRRLWELAEMLVDPKHPGDFNQGVMELGATLCTPEAPDCVSCPLAGGCAARHAGRQTEFPQVPRGPDTLYVEHASAVVRQQGKLLLVRRRPNGLWGGLWELPRAICRPEESLQQCACRAAEEAVGVTLRAGERLAVVRHTVTHHRITLSAVAGEIASGEPQAVGCDAWEWLLPDEIAARALAAPQARLLRRVNAAMGQ